MLALPCAPEGRPDAAAAAVMLAGCCRGVDWSGLGCMYEINYFESRTTRSRCCATHPFLFLFAFSRRFFSEGFI